MVKMAYNGLGLCEGKELELQMFNKVKMMIVAQMFKLARMPCFCKTPVIGSAFLGFSFPPILNEK